MTGIDFLNLASDLSQSGDESRLRTAVSRAYYGAFHATRDLLYEVGIQLPRGEKDHAKIPYCFLNCGNPIGQELGKRLESLRIDRNAADYDLADNRFNNPVVVAARIQSAKQIFHLISLSRVEPGKSAVQPGLLKYARDILRLPVTKS